MQRFMKNKRFVVIVLSCRIVILCLDLMTVYLLRMHGIQAVTFCCFSSGDLALG